MMEFFLLSMLWHRHIKATPQLCCDTFLNLAPSLLQAFLTTGFILLDEYLYYY
jgi:hypothetical protein